MAEDKVALPPAKLAAPKTSAVNLSMLSSMGIAIAIHVLIALAVGSYVVFEGIVPMPFFESDFVDNSSQAAMIEEAPTIIEEDPLPEVQTTEVETVVEESGGSDAGPDMSDLITVTSATTSPSFSIPTTAGNPGLLTGSLLKGSGSGSGSGPGKGSGILTAFGRTGATPGTLKGKFYDFKRDKKGKPNGQRPSYSAILPGFFKKGAWEVPDDMDYYTSETTLYLKALSFRTTQDVEAGRAFQCPETLPGSWIAHYYGTVVAERSGDYRFYGWGDNICLIGLDGEVVLEANDRNYLPDSDKRVRVPGFASRAVNGGLYNGPVVSLKKGQSYRIDILMGDQGGLFSAGAFLLKDGETYGQEGLMFDRPMLLFNDLDSEEKQLFTDYWTPKSLKTVILRAQ
jgi:hypothetical protein